MGKHTIDELKQWQALPLSIKVRMTMERIRAWVNKYGEDGVYISFSGGKDSTVLLDIARNKCGYNLPCMFVDVPTQYPELREFVKTFDNVDIVKPNISFAEVCSRYGFPLISKEVSECVSGAKRYLTSIINENTLDRQTDGRISISTINYADSASMRNPSKGGADSKYRKLRGIGEFSKQKNGKQRGRGESETCDNAGMLGKDQRIKANIPKCDRSAFSQEKYKFMLGAPFDISNKCCNVMKKEPAHRYEKQTGRVPITAQMASESRLRTQKWLQNGCNAFDAKKPISNPMSFWTENDVLQYIVENNLRICSVYGDVVPAQRQLTLNDIGVNCVCEEKKYKTTGCQRTGCMLCGFGCHLEKEGEGRFELLKETHPGMYKLLDKIENNGVTFKEAIEWTNEHGNLHIRL